MNPIRLVAVFAENRAGQLAKVTQLLAEAQLNLHWLGVASTERYGVIRFLVNRCDDAFQLLKAHGFTVSLVEIVAVEVEDKPGSLHAIASLLSQHGVSLNNCSGFVFNNRAILLLELTDLAKARDVLDRQGWRQLDEQELLRL